VTLAWPFRLALLSVAVAHTTPIAVAAAQPPLRPGPPPGGGLACHRVLVATSRDGLSFATEDRVVLDRASVPEAVAEGDGARLYYVSGEPGHHGIWTARIAGGRVAPPTRVLLDGAFVGDAVDPDVVRLPDGRYRLYYFLGHFVTRPPVRSPIHPIYSAISSDGVGFTVEGKAIEAEGVTDPSVVRLPDGAWLMALAQPHARRILIAAGRDGRTFAQTGTDLSGGIPELTALPDGSVRLFHNVPGGIGSSVSSDGGQTWRTEPGLRLRYAGLAADPSVIRSAHGEWTMYFKTLRPGCPGPGG
jgi:hypothetical protein